MNENQNVPRGTIEIPPGVTARKGSKRLKRSTCRYCAAQAEFPFVLNLSLTCEQTSHRADIHIPLTRDEALDIAKELTDALLATNVIDTIHHP